MKDDVILEDSRLISRAAARAAGVKRYLTGERCIHGHINERLVSNGSCLTCLAIRKAAEKARDPERIRAIARNNYHKRPQHHCDRRRENLYGVTPEGYDRILKRQGGVCAICGERDLEKDSYGAVRRLSVDHCHDMGFVRGLLCNKCNRFLGKLEKRLSLLPVMLGYLDPTNPKVEIAMRDIAQMLLLKKRE